MTDGGPSEEWVVGVVWLTRRLLRPDRMLRDRLAAVRPRRASGAGKGAEVRGRDLLDGCTDEFALLLLVIVFGFFVGPILLVVTALAAELVLVFVLGAIAPLLRIVFRQPWEVVARSPGDEVTWRVRGMQAARTLVGEVESAIRLGLDPRDVRPERRDHDAPALQGVPGLYRAGAFRLLGRFLGVLIGIGVAVLIAVAWAASGG